MSSPSPYTRSRQTTYFPSARRPSMYRQTDYHDGKGFQVIESRRRAPVNSMSMSAHKDHALAPPSASKKALSSLKSNEVSSEPIHRRFTSTPPPRDQLGHVMPRPSPKTKSRGQVVIVQGSVSIAVDLGKRDVSIGLATPPSTPRIGRLPTPELEDLDVGPFCDCCTGRRVVKYCAGCGCELDS